MDQKLQFPYPWTLGLYKERPSYRRSLQLSKENIQHFKNMKFFNFFLLLWVIFALLDPDSESGSTDPIESGSNWDPDPDPQPWKKFYNSLKTGPNFFLQHIKNKIIYNYVKFYHPSLLLRFLDPGSDIRDPVWIKNQDPGSATLQLYIFSNFCHQNWNWIRIRS